MAWVQWTSRQVGEIIREAAQAVVKFAGRHLGNEPNRGFLIPTNVIE